MPFPMTLGETLILLALVTSVVGCAGLFVGVLVGHGWR
jgi:hypothetical protein